MKKSFFLIAGVVLISAVLFVGCKKEAAQQPSDPNYAVEISIFHETGGHPQPAATNPIYQYLKEKLNVTFTWDILVGDINQRRGTMIAGRTYPDIIELRGNEWIQAGALIPLEDLIAQYAPNIRTHYADTWEKMRSEDGHIYYLVNYGVFQGIDHTPNYDQAAFWIQKEILRQAGFPKVTTLDQYFDLIRKYYAANPTINGQPTIPFVILTHDWRAFELWNPPNFLSGHPNDGNGIVTQQGNNYTYEAFFTLDVSKRWFQYLNARNAEGLIDRTSFTDTYDQYSAKIASGRVLAQSVQGWQFGTPDAANRDANGNWRTMAPLPIVFDSSITPHYRNITIPNLLRGPGISVSAKDPARIVRFWGELIKDEVQRTINWGIEGQHWQWNAQHEPYRTQAQRDNWNNQNWQEQNRGLLLGDVMPKIQGSFSDGYPADLSLYYPEREATLRPEDRELYAAYGVTGTNAMMDPNPPPNSLWFPTWNMDFAVPEEGSPASIALARMEEIMKQRLPAIILAAPAQFETMWAAYVAEMTAAGLASYNQHMQTELNKRIRAWGGGR
jgi:putative aldouronate transport system substrate-binding protein